MDRKFLLTFSFENDEGMDDKDFKWYETEEEMLKDIEDMKAYTKDLEVMEAIEMLSFRLIEVVENQVTKEWHPEDDWTDEDYDEQHKEEIEAQLAYERSLCGDI